MKKPIHHILAKLNLHEMTSEKDVKKVAARLREVHQEDQKKSKKN